MDAERFVVVRLPDGHDLTDPDPAITDARGVTLSDRWEDGTVGVVGWSSGGIEALRDAIQHPNLPRLVLAATPFPEELPDDLDLDAVTAKTLLLFGTKDPLTGNRHGTAWQRALPNARLEMVPGAGHDLLAEKWKRVLSHLSPGTTRRGSGAGR